MGQTIAVVNEKGGVGKTTTSIHLSYALAERGYRVCLVDNDNSGDSGKALFEEVPEQVEQRDGRSNTLNLYDSKPCEPIQVTDNLYFIGSGSNDALSNVDKREIDAAFDFADSIRDLEEEFDFIIIDCPPSLNLMFMAALMAASTGGALVPFMPDELSTAAATRVYKRVDSLSKRMKLDTKVLGFMANNFRVNPMPQSVLYYLEDMGERYGGLVMDTYRYNSVYIADSLALKLPLSQHVQAVKGNKQTAERAFKVLAQMDKVAEEVLKRLDKPFKKEEVQ